MQSFRHHDTERGPILPTVTQPLLWRGFNPSQFQVDIPTTQNGPYRFETYHIGSANLAILSLPPHVCTEANLFLGPDNGSNAHFSFQAHCLAGSGELLLTQPGSYDFARIPLSPGAPSHKVYSGRVYAYRASSQGLVVADYCDPAFQPPWERSLGSESDSNSELRLPPGFWKRLRHARPLGDPTKGTDCNQE